MGHMIVKKREDVQDLPSFKVHSQCNLQLTRHLHSMVSSGIPPLDVRCFVACSTEEVSRTNCFAFPAAIFLQISSDRQGRVQRRQVQ